MSRLQKWLTRLLPAAWMELIRSESMTWMLRCPCGHARSVWEAGGVRWRAAGTRRFLARCSWCGQRTWHSLSRDV